MLETVQRQRLVLTLVRFRTVERKRYAFEKSIRHIICRFVLVGDVKRRPELDYQKSERFERRGKIINLNILYFLII